MNDPRLLDPWGRPETPAQRTARIAREEAIFAKAEADIDAGLGIDEETFDAYFDALDRADEARDAEIQRVQVGH